MLFLKQQGITQADILAMDADMLQGTLLSFGVTFNELTNPFKVKWITPQWQDAEFIDQYLLQFQTDLAKKNCGLMPSITDLETLDPAYIQAVVQGATGILRSTHISDGYFSTDAPRSFRHLLFPTCIDQVHFGLLVLHFDDKAESEGIFYFEPKKKRNFLNLATIFKDMKDVAKIQIPMDQIDDDFCGDYVISVIQGYANNLNPKIISWSEYKMNADSQLSKILADQHYSQFVGRALPIESIEYLRCDMAIQLGRTFVNYLNQRSLISEADFQEKVLPDIQKRHAELRNLKHIWQTTALVENDPRSDIDMHALKGSNLREKLLDYITTHEGTTKNSCLILDAEETISQKNQRGETCKLVALANAIEHTAYKTKPLNPPIPLYKDKTSAVSLRQLAKQYTGSMVGEMYSVESLLMTCRAAEYEAEYYAPGEEDSYIQQLKILIDQGFSAMVFFDLDATPGSRHGKPRIGDGRNEHAAVAIGYYTDANEEIHFIVTHWDRFFDFDGQELALSSCHALANQREIETFCKVQHDDGKTSWVLKKHAPMFKKIVENTPDRTALPMAHNATPLKGKIIVVTNPRSDNTNLFFSASKEKVQHGNEMEHPCPVHTDTLYPSNS